MTAYFKIAVIIFTSFYFCFSVISSFAQAPQLTITEVFPDPKAVGDSDGEWFELYNPTDQGIPLKGVTVRDDGRDSYTIEEELTVSPKSYAVFCKNKNTAENGGVSCLYQYTKFSLANESDEIILENNGQIARLVYAKPTHPIKSGKSMELDGSTWHEATNQFGKGDYGTPGSGNSAPPVPTNIPEPTATSTPKPTKTPTIPPTIKPTEVDKVQAQVLAVEDIKVPEVTPQDDELMPTEEIENTIVDSKLESSAAAELKESSGVGKFFMWGGVLSMMGAIASFLWISNKGFSS